MVEAHEVRALHIAQHLVHIRLREIRDEIGPSALRRDLGPDAVDQRMRQLLRHLDLADGREGVRLRAAEERDARPEHRLARDGSDRHVRRALAPHGDRPRLGTIHRVRLEHAAPGGAAGRVRLVRAALVVVREAAERLRVQCLQAEGRIPVAHHADHFAHRLAEHQWIRAPKHQVHPVERPHLDKLEHDVAALRLGPDHRGDVGRGEAERELARSGIPGRLVRRVELLGHADAQQRGRLAGREQVPARAHASNGGQRALGVDAEHGAIGREGGDRSRRCRHRASGCDRHEPHRQEAPASGNDRKRGHGPTISKRPPGTPACSLALIALIGPCGIPMSEMRPEVAQSCGAELFSAVSPSGTRQGRGEPDPLTCRTACGFQIRDTARCNSELLSPPGAPLPVAPS